MKETEAVTKLQLTTQICFLLFAFSVISGRYFKEVNKGGNSSFLTACQKKEC